MIRHLSNEELEAGLDEIRRSPKDSGVLNLIVRRPEIEQREVLDVGTLGLAEGLVGDNWKKVHLFAFNWKGRSLCVLLGH